MSNKEFMITLEQFQIACSDEARKLRNEHDKLSPLDYSLDTLTLKQAAYERGFYRGADWALKWLQDQQDQAYQPIAQLVELEAALFLVACDIAMISKDKNTLTCCLCCNDTFGYATADAEPIEWHEAPALKVLYEQEGWQGLIRWIAKKRGVEPLPEMREALKRSEEK